MNIGPYLTGINATPEFGVYHGDSWDLVQEIPDASIDLICTDPEYNRAEDYLALAKLARRVLKPTGHLLTFYGIGYTEQTYAALRNGGMPVKWELVVWQPGQTGRVHGKLFVAHYNAVWCPYGSESAMLKATVDLKTSYAQTMRGRSSAWSWRKNPIPIAEWLPAFCPLNGVVLDIFAGFSSIAEAAIMTGRSYLAFEKDEEKVAWSREWLANNVQPALLAEDGDEYIAMSLFGPLEDEDAAEDNAESA